MPLNDFAGRTLVVRIDEGTLTAGGSTFLDDLAFLVERRVSPIVVAPSTDVARAVVRTMNRTGDTAVGLSGADAGLVPSSGAGGIGAIQSRLLRTLSAAGYIPVIEPTALGIFGTDVAVSADDLAGAIASATEATRAIFFHDAGGIADGERLIDELTPAEALTLSENESLDPTLRAAVRAAALGVRGGVGAAQIVDGRIAHAAIVEFLTARHLGTQVAGTVFMR